MEIKTLTKEQAKNLAEQQTLDLLK